MNKQNMPFWKLCKNVAICLLNIDVSEDLLGIWVGLSMLVWNIGRLLLCTLFALLLPISTLVFSLALLHLRKQCMHVTMHNE